MQLLPSPCFQNLRELCIQHCGLLKYLFSSSIVANLKQLNRLVIRRCEMVEEILSQLPKLTKFSTGIFIEFPLLNELEIVDCPQLMTSVYTSNTTNTSINQFLASNLTKLVVEKCGSLKYLVSSSAAVNLVQLNRLEIINCEKMEEITSMNQRTDKMLFPKLNYLHLSSLPKLTRFCAGTFVEFPLLTKLRMVECPEFAGFIYSSNDKEVGDVNSEDNLCSTTLSLFHDKVTFPSLQIINIRRLDRLKMIWQGQASPTCFQNLMQLHIGECRSMKYLFSSYAVTNLVQLKKLKISCCERMEAIISIDQRMDELIFPNLDYLELLYLPQFTRFCNGTSSIKFPLLTELRMEDCPEFMSFIYTSSIIRTNMLDNEELKEMKLKDHAQLRSPMLCLLDEKAVFPNLEIIDIKRLNCLRTVWQDQFMADSLCKLKVIEVQHCENLSFVFPSNMLGRLHNLRRVYIRPCKMLEEVTYDLDLEAFILVGKDGHEEGPRDLNNILGGKENCSIVFSRVKSLQLHVIPTLMHLFEENSQLREAFQSLEDLLVRKCLMLKNLVPSSTSLSNLTSLSVSRCHGIVNLLSCSTARSLARLRDMSIDECQKMTKIIADEKSCDVDIEGEITFSSLEVLRLNRLPSLTSFHSENHLMRFPKLKTVIVMECPEMSNFCYVASHIVTRELPLVQSSEEENSLPQVALQNLEILFVRRCDSLKNLVPLSIFFKNLTILRVAACNGMVNLLTCSIARSLSRLKTLSIIKCQRMVEIIASEGCDSDHTESEIIFNQLEILSLHKLPRLASFHLGECTMRFPKLKTVIMMECLEMQSFCFQNLEILDVGVCGKLKNLVTTSISLQNLTTLRVSSCDGMVNLLSCSTAKSLVQLKNMSISECQIMTEVIANDQGGDVNGEDEVIFDSLEVLELHSLPNLTSVHSGNNIMRFLKLKRVIISRCPQMQSFSYGVIAPNLKKIITRINERYIRAQNCWNIKGYFEDLEQAMPMEELWRVDIHSTIQDMWELNH
ncbi:LRR domain containing protein [Trema orientale]|uniref:LRR domain containing protein n=1 Tax=Trema orientale TaxID=63057 RepID=A0A2P5BIJ0_TREOI|nr:LRR domain containing protein [Trema orientale]